MMSCPMAPFEAQIITLEHGSGGRSSSELINRLFLPAFRNEALELLHDGAAIDLESSKLAFATDAFVIQPIFFPGGDIGKLAVTGTINDLAMCGAKPCYLSCSFIIEEGFRQDDLARIVNSMQKEAHAQSVSIVTGDTKVIERHSGKNIFITTSGIGIRTAPNLIHSRRVQPGDAIIISNDIGRHGIVVMAEREGFSFQSALISDCASLSEIVQALIEADIEIHCLRDLTRGGLATALVEIAQKANMDYLVSEQAIPVDPIVANACELLGFDPLYIANEGCFAAFVPARYADQTIHIMKRFPQASHATVIGRVLSSEGGCVQLENKFGGKRYLHMLSGAPMPRIC
jgi:hydrogenase expression/formation protein HypE